MAKNHTETLVFTTLDILQIKKLIIIYIVKPLYLRINHANGYIKQKRVNEYLIFGSTDENKQLLKKYNDVWNGIKNKIKKVSSDNCDYIKRLHKN